LKRHKRHSFLKETKGENVDHTRSVGDPKRAFGREKKVHVKGQEGEISIKCQGETTGASVKKTRVEADQTIIL